MLNKCKYIGLKRTYSVLNYLTNNFRLSFLIKIKIAVGLALISTVDANAQKKVDFPNTENKVDTLNLDVELEEDDSFTLCYEVVVVRRRYRQKDPKFKGGQHALNKFVRENVSYPQEAIDNDIEGNVAVNVSIDEEGNVTNAYVVNAIGHGLDEEALRLVRMMPKFKPGKAYGKVTEQNKTIVIHFEMPKK
ncbi:energy transducer TonB [Puteibacter caeruleilacunae]|nr:energy transducer TonB [Puteibacter caeruleilacunae]